MRIAAPAITNHVALSGFSSQTASFRDSVADKLRLVGFDVSSVSASDRSSNFHTEQGLFVHLLSQRQLPSPNSTEFGKLLRFFDKHELSGIFLAPSLASGAAVKALSDPSWLQFLSEKNVALATNADDVVASAVRMALDITRERAARSRDLNSLDDHPVFKSINSDLRSARGHLDAKKIAYVFGMSYTALAKVLDVNLQTVLKTTDSATLQPKLREFDRIARLRTLGKVTSTYFRKWLNSEIEALKNKSPLDWIRGGKAEIVANLVDNLVTSQPT